MDNPVAVVLQGGCARAVAGPVVPVGFVKVVADATHNELLGAHMIGPEVTELLPVLTLAQLWDLTADEVARKRAWGC